MWDFSIGQALALMARTAPFVLFRVLVYFAVSAAFVVVTGTGAGIGYGVGLFGDEEFRTSATVYGAIGGFGLTAGVIFFLRDYLLYLVKAGHLAVMVELMEGREVPGGQGQVAWAQGVVRERFGTASALFGLDVLIRGVVGAVTGLLQGILSFLPIPGLDRLAAALRAYLKIAAGLIDEVILAQILRTRSDNPWKTGQEALVLYAQNARPLLVNAAWLTLIVWVLSLLVFLVMLAPAAAVVWLIPGPATGGMMVFAILFAWAVKAALIEPFALACLLQVYFKVTAGQQPDPDWTARLSQASDKFRSLGEKAAGWVSGRRSAPPTA